LWVKLPFWTSTHETVIYQGHRDDILCLRIQARILHEACANGKLKHAFPYLSSVIQSAIVKDLRAAFNSNWVKRVGWGLFVLLFLWARVHWPVRAFDATGPAALRDLAFTLILWSLTLILCFSSGIYLLRIFHLEHLENLEKDVFAFALGFGAVSYWILLLAFLQLLNLLALATSLIAAAILVAPEATRSVGRIIALPGKIRQAWRSASTTGKVVVSVSLVIAGLSFVNALTPAWDYDGLMYHLVGPKLFVEAGKLFPFPDNWYINGPFTIEMAFSLGMVFRDDVFPKLIHFSLGTLYVLTGYLLARRLLKREKAWLVLALIMGIPILPILAGFAYIDLGWSAFEVLAVLAFLIGDELQENKYLILSGMMSGLAMGSKYLGLQGFCVLGLLLLLIRWRKGWRALLQAGIYFGIPAICIASPWYIKNAVWFGNPVFPFFLGGQGWDPARLDLYQSYLQSFGYGRSALDYVLLPIHIYTHPERFGAVMNQIDIPNPLFLLACFVPLFKKTRTISILLAISVLRFALWSFGSQQTRFLTPIFPLIAVMTVYVLQAIFSKRTKLARYQFAVSILCVALMAIPLFYQTIYTGQYRPFGVVLGTESKSQYLSRIVSNYPAISYAKENRLSEQHILLFGDGQGFYCLPDCVPDPDHFRWAGEIARLESSDNLGTWFSNHALGYLVLNREYLDFLLQHDSKGVMEAALRRLIAWRDEGCLRSLYDDDWVVLYEVVCPSDPASSDARFVE